MPLPAACSTPVGIFNKEISFVLVYEGHFENRSDSTNDFFLTTLSFTIHLSSVVVSLLLYPAYSSPAVNAILLVTGNEYANQKETTALAEQLKL